MTEVLQLPSPSSCSSSPFNDVSHSQHQQHHQTNSSPFNNSDNETVMTHYQIQQQQQQLEESEEEEEEEKDQLSILTLLIATFRKSLIGCTNTGSELSSSSSMEIGWPSNVRHVAHVTFDRFHGFLGLPVEFEPEVPRRPPSARLGFL